MLPGHPLTLSRLVRAVNAEKSSHPCASPLLDSKRVGRQERVSAKPPTTWLLCPFMHSLERVSGQHCGAGPWTTAHSPQPGEPGVWLVHKSVVALWPVERRLCPFDSLPGKPLVRSGLGRTGEMDALVKSESKGILDQTAKTASDLSLLLVHVLAVLLTLALRCALCALLSAGCLIASRSPCAATYVTPPAVENCRPPSSRITVHLTHFGRDLLSGLGNAEPKKVTRQGRYEA